MTSRFCVVRVTCPMWPGIFMPRMTVPGNRRWPMAPLRRCQPLAPCVESPPRKTMALHHAFKTAAFRDANRVHKIAGRKQRRADDVAGLHFLGEIPEFLDAFHRRAVLLLDVAEQRLGEALFLLVVEAELHGVVAVLAGLRFDLQHAVGAGEHDRHGNQHAAARYRRACCRVFFLKVRVAWS